MYSQIKKDPEIRKQNPQTPKIMSRERKKKTKNLYHFKRHTSSHKSLVKHKRHVFETLPIGFKIP